MKTFRCDVCGEEYEFFHLCFGKPKICKVCGDGYLPGFYHSCIDDVQDNNEIICQKCGHRAKEHNENGCIWPEHNVSSTCKMFCMCEKSKADIIRDHYKTDKCPNCAHERSKHGECGCRQIILLSNGEQDFCPCNKPQSEIPDKPKIEESGIKCPDCGCDVNLHSDVDSNDYATMEYYGCNNHKGSKSAVCSCNLKFEDALNKAVEYAGGYSAKAIALRVSYEQNKRPEPQTCVVCDDIYTRKEDIEAGIVFATIDHTRFVCETCHRKIIKCVAGRMNQ